MLLITAACGAPEGVELRVLTPFDPLLVEVPAPWRVDLEDPDAGRLRLGEGWYVWERESRVRPWRKLLWCGPVASLDFAAAGGQRLDFVATLMPATSESSPAQVVQIDLDGTSVGEWRLAPGLAEHRLELPERAAQPGFHRLVLRFSSAHRRDGQEADDALPRSAAFTELTVVPRGAAANAQGSSAELRAPIHARLGTSDDSLLLPLPTGAARWSLRGGSPGTRLRYRIVAAPAAAGPWQEIAVGTSPVEVALEPSSTLRKLQLGLLAAAPGARPLELELHAGDPPAAAQRRGGPPDIVLYTIDTLRADALGAYGAERDTSPHIDALARDGVLFERASSASSWTIPSTRALLTGSHPAEDGPRAPAGADAATPLAVRLQQQGYETVAIVQSQLVTASYGFADGFDAFYVADALGRCTNESRAAVWYLWQHLFAHRDPDKPLFLYVHTVDPHAPYTPTGEDRRYVANPFAFLRRFAYHPVVFMRDPEAHGPREVATMRGLYHGDVRRNDRSFGALVELLAQLGLYDDSLVVLTADHGEELGEHGGFSHGRTLFEEALHVPLIFKHPRGEGAGSRVSTPVSGVDVAPTLLEWAGAPSAGAGEGLDGRSLARATAGLPEVPVIARVSAHEGDGLPTVALGAVRSGAVKCIVHRGGRDRFGHPVPPILAFDLEADPEERHPLALEASEAACRHLVDALLPELPAAALDPLDAETRARLQALGYL